MPRALRSMTAYAESRVERNGWVARISLRSVNHRFLDLRLRLPDGCEGFEPVLRDAVRGRIGRGHVDLLLAVESARPAVPRVNEDAAAVYLRAMQELRERFGLIGEPDLATVLRLPGVLGPPALVTEEERERLGELVRRAAGLALDRLEEMRESEGRKLAEEMLARLLRVSRNIAQIEALADRIRPAYARRLDERLKELLGETQLDPARVAQEAALLALRTDTTEETTRLRSHIEQIERLLAEPEEAGKKLDFLLQEMHREANTILSKAPGPEADGIAITEMALEVKADVEKLREQAQNIE
jgi:uncharacterized protein (TIGR00255 family)